MRKKLAVLGLGMILAAGVLAGCGSSTEQVEKTTGQDASTGTEASEAGTTTADGSSDSADGVSLVEGNYTIGISQFAEHGSLENCKKGFLKGLEEEGFVVGKNLKIDEQNALADTGTANQIAMNFVSQKVDLICAIATPSAQSAYNAAMDAKIPVVYTAVTDPIAAELADANQVPVGNVTGTSDKLPVKEQLIMIRDLMPESKKIGIMYSTSEVNSLTTVAEYKSLASEYGFEIVESGVSTAADIPLAADNLLEKVDCITNLTDNLVVNSLPLILDKANAKKIPVYGSEVEQVKLGCVASEGIEYISLGEQTGKMAARILKGEAKAGEMPVESIEQSSLYLNTKAASALGITIGEELTKRALEVFDSVSK